MIMRSSPPITRRTLHTCLLLTLLMLSGQNFAMSPIAATAHPELKALGTGKLTFFGLHVYDSTLYVASGRFDVKETFALDLIYQMNFKGNEIAAQSTKELARVGYSDRAKLARWELAMANVFPNIKPGDRLTGVSVAKNGAPFQAHFYSQSKHVGTIDDPEFAQAFFDIWLSPKTREPQLRQRLLTPPAPSTKAAGSAP